MQQRRIVLKLSRVVTLFEFFSDPSFLLRFQDADPLEMDWWVRLSERFLDPPPINFVHDNFLNNSQLN